MVSLSQFGEILSTLQAPALAVHPEYCSRIRHRLSKCTLCSDKCPTQAIEWGEGSLNIDPDKCSSCGICASVCPNGVFDALKPTNVEILDQVKALLSQGKEVVFECNPQRAERQTDTIQVPCLGRIDEGFLMGCVALGARSILLSPAECQGCPNESGKGVIQEKMDGCNKLLAFWGLPPLISLGQRKVVSMEPRKTSRREFFANIKQETKKLGTQIATNMISKVQEKPTKHRGSLPTYLPMKRELLLTAMAKLGKPTEGVVESPLFCQFGVTEACTGCQMCAFFCPTGALTKLEEEGKFGVRFKPSECTCCGLCQDICYKQAVQLSHQVNLREVVARESEVVIMQKGRQVLPWEEDVVRENMPNL